MFIQCVTKCECDMRGGYFREATAPIMASLLAPWMRLTSAPALRNTNVGMASMWYCAETRCSLKKLEAGKLDQRGKKRDERGKGSLYFAKLYSFQLWIF